MSSPWISWQRLPFLHFICTLPLNKISPVRESTDSWSQVPEMPGPQKRTLPTAVTSGKPSRGIGSEPVICMRSPYTFSSNSSPVFTSKRGVPSPRRISIRNGTGTTSTLEAARILTAAGARPKRTIRFLLWGGEEQGLLGSTGYVRMHRAEMDRVVAVFNHDGGTNWAQSLTVTEAMAPAFEQVLEPVRALPLPVPAEWDGPVFSLETAAQIGVGGGSDHVSFQVAGVPAWSWGQVGRTDYGYGWHSQWDTYDIVVPEYQRHTATVVAHVARGIANLPEPLTREGVTRERARGGEHSLEAYLDRLFGVELADDNTVDAVRDGGPAARAGLRPGDRITAVWGEFVSQPMELFGPWREHREDADIAFTVERDGAKLDLRAPKEDPAAAERADRNGESAAPNRNETATSRPSQGAGGDGR